MKHETQEYRARVFTEWRHLSFVWLDGDVYSALAALTGLPPSVVRVIVKEQADLWAEQSRAENRALLLKNARAQAFEEAAKIAKDIRDIYNPSSVTAWNAADWILEQIRAKAKETR